MLRILLVQHHTTFREALALVLRQQLDVSLVVETDSLADATWFLHDIDIALVDVDVPDGQHEALLRDLRQMTAECTVLALAGRTSTTIVEAAWNAGAVAVLHKDVRLGDLFGCLRRAARGEALCPFEGTTVSLHAKGPPPSPAGLDLTVRERELLQALARGLTDDEIAGHLEVRPQTVRKYLMSIFGKFGVASRLQAVIFALRHGLVRLD